MSVDKIFVDTNILVYGHDKDAGQKNHIAQNLLTELWNSRRGVLSIQVLQEFYVTLTRKVSHPLSPSAVRNLIRDYISWQVEVNDTDSVLKASRIEENYRISFWDALIVTAAMKAKVSKILSEDFQSGQMIEGMLLENPFHSMR